MTCGKKHCQNAPTEATRVDPTEVEGRPLCDHAGCEKRVVGDGTRCADGHVQGALRPMRDHLRDLLTKLVYIPPIDQMAIERGDLRVMLARYAYQLAEHGTAENCWIVDDADAGSWYYLWNMDEFEARMNHQYRVGTDNEPRLISVEEFLAEGLPQVFQHEAAEDRIEIALRGLAAVERELSERGTRQYDWDKEEPVQAARQWAAQAPAAEKPLVGELLEGYVLDVASYNQLGQPISFTGPGTYSRDDDGVFRRGSFATTSRLRIDPALEEEPAASEPFPPFLAGTLALLQAPNDALTAAEARAALRRLRGLPPEDAAVATALLLGAVPIEQARPLARTLSALLGTYPDWATHKRQETVLRRQLYQEFWDAGLVDDLDSRGLPDLAEAVLYSYAASQGEPPPARAVPGADDAPRPARVRTHVERIAEELTSHPPDELRELLWDTPHLLLAKPEKEAVDILAWRGNTYWRVRVQPTATGWRVQSTATDMTGTGGEVSPEEMARIRVQGLVQGQQQLCPTCGLLLNTADQDEHYCGWRGEFPTGLARLMRGTEDRWYDLPAEQRRPAQILPLVVRDVLEGYRDLAEAREEAAEAERMGDDFYRFTARGHAITPSVMRWAVEFVQSHPEANPFGTTTA